MEEMGLGPNGGLMACFEYLPFFSPPLSQYLNPLSHRFLLENLDWLDETLIPSLSEETLTIFDCPGQIELYTHVPILPTLTTHLRIHHDFSLCAAYLLESTFLLDKAKFFSGTLSAMSAMIMLEIPHLNLLSKMDLVKSQIPKRELKRFLDPDPSIITTDIHAHTNPRFHRLNEAIVGLIDDFSMVQFLQVEAANEDKIQAVLSYIDNCIGWSEVQEPKMPDNEDYDPTALGE